MLMFITIKQVFNNPEQIMNKFVPNIYQLKIQEYISTKLSAKIDTYNYLKILCDLYSKTNQLSNDLAGLNMGVDRRFLTKRTSNIFNKYIDNYIKLKLKCFRERCCLSRAKYYESKIHQTKQIQLGVLF